MNSLTALLNKYSSDKGTVDTWNDNPNEIFRNKRLMHGYSIIYDEILQDYKNKNNLILEIGCVGDTPLSSLKAWKEYFVNSKIVGFDLNGDKIIGQGFDINTGSQESISDLYDLVNKYKSFDIIIDDGSHFHKHQIGNFLFLIHFLNKGGIYIIEDVNVSPETYSFFSENVSKFINESKSVGQIRFHKSGLIIINKF